VAGRGAGGNCPFREFWTVGKLSEIYLLVGKFSSKNAKFGAKNPPFEGNLGAKLKL